MQVRLGKGHESPPEYCKEEDVPDFIPKEAPLDEGFVTVSRLWSVLVFILGVSIKMYGYLQKDAGADNQKFSVSLETLFLFFLFLVGSVFCKKMCPIITLAIFFVRIQNPSEWSFFGTHFPCKF